jgi:hypothetical protein
MECGTGEIERYLTERGGERQKNIRGGNGTKEMDIA